jgi:hypothetical protein
MVKGLVNIKIKKKNMKDLEDVIMNKNIIK